MRSVTRVWGVWAMLLTGGIARPLVAEDAPEAPEEKVDTAADEDGRAESNPERPPKTSDNGGAEAPPAPTPADTEPMSPTPGAVSKAPAPDTSPASPKGEDAPVDATQTDAPEPAPLSGTEKKAISAEAKVLPPVPAAQAEPAEAASPVPAESTDASADVPTADDTILTGTWTKRILFQTPSGAFKFQPRGWLQPRFRLAVNGDEDYNGDEPLAGTQFSLKRARFGFQAWLFSWARMYLDTGWNARGGRLIDYYVDVGPENGAGPIALRIGFFRPYFIRQLLHATTQLAMIEYAKAWTDEPLGLGIGPSGRQLGIGVQGFVAGGFEYGVGIWNGADTFAEMAEEPAFMGGGRIAVHPLGLAGVGNAIKPGNESDTAISDKPGLSLGAAVYFEDRKNVVSILPALAPYEDRQLKVGVDLAFQYRGLSLEGEMFLVRAFAADGGVADTLSLAYLDAPGISTYFQAGYMITKRFELVGRFDMVDENTEIRGIRFYPTVGATVFIYGNNLKFQTQYRVNIGADYEVGDVAGDPYIPVTHDVFFMLQASI